MPQAKKEEGPSKKDLAIFISLAILLILIVAISVSINSKLNKQITSLTEKITDLENSVSGQSDEQFLSLSEELEITKANIFACDIDRNCESLFNNRKYECPSNLEPTCVDKFCRCQ
jgi:predicted PurR-regulated permease PerM